MRKFVSVVLGLALVAPLVVTTQGCSSSAKKKSKAAAPKTVAAAEAAKEKTGAVALGSKDKATTKPEEGGKPCTADLENLGFCATEATIVFCSAGVWHELSCPALGTGTDICAAEGAVVDCFPAGETE
jgi:hypothetical protein